MQRKICRTILILLLATFFTFTFLEDALAQPSQIKRLSGSDRYRTAAAISQKGWKSSRTVILARGDDFADALCAGPLAQKLNSPILLTEPYELNGYVLNEIKRLGAGSVIIIGAEGAVSKNVENSLKTAGISDIQRICGNDRYETALKIAEKISTSTSIALVSGKDYPDALSISTVASKTGMPILLTEKNSLPHEVDAYIKANKINSTYIIGGEGVISKDIEKLVPNPVRIGGRDRFETNKLVMEKFKGQLSFNKIYVSGDGFADALCGSVIAARTSSPIVLSGGYLPDITGDFLESNISVTSSIIALGGESVVPRNVLDRIYGYIDIMQKTVYDKPGTYGSEEGTGVISGSVVINVPGITLQNTVIEGDLLVSEGVGNGTVYLRDVTVRGSTVVRGGGPDSVVMYNFNGSTITVDVPDGRSVRLVAEGNTSVDFVFMESGGKLEETNVTGAGFTTVQIPEGAEVVLSGTFDTVNIESGGASVNLERGNINTLNITETAAGAEVNLSRDSTVSTLTADAPSKFSGQGSITTANINANGTVIEQNPASIKIGDGITANVGGQDQGGNNAGSTGNNSSGDFVTPAEAPDALLSAGTNSGTTRITGLEEGTVYQFVIDKNESQGVNWTNPIEDAATAEGIIDNVAADAEQFIHIRVKYPLSYVKDIDVTLTDLKPASAPEVIGSDDTNTVSGIDGTMEFSTDGTNWTLYDEGASNLPDITGSTILQVRVKETLKQPASEIKTLTFTPPFVKDDTAEVDEDGTVLIDVMANDGHMLEVAEYTQGSHGTVEKEGDSLRYTPASNYNGSDSFSYTVDDGHGGTNTATVNVTINPVNDAPAASDDTAEVDEDGTVLIDVLANDTDVEGDTLSITSLTQGSHGTVEKEGDSLRYTPAANYNGSDSFSYTVDDGHGGIATAAVAVTVNPDNSDFNIKLVEVSDKVSGQSFDINIYDAKDTSGSSFEGNVSVTVTDNLEGQVYCTNTVFTNGTAAISIVLNTTGTHTLTVSIEGVDVSKSIEVNVTAPSVKAPEAASKTPAPGMASAFLNEVVSVVFDMDVAANNLNGITIVDNSIGHQVTGVSGTLNGRTLSIFHDNFQYSKAYTVTIPAGAVMNSDGIGSGEITWSFTTRGAPTLPLKVAMVTGIGGLGDQSYYDTAYNGLQAFERDFDAKITVIESVMAMDYFVNLSSLAEEGYDFIWATDFLMKDALMEVAELYPDTRFGILGAEVDLPNVVSVTFRVNEGSFLAGIVAGMKTITNKVGFIGGMDVSEINIDEAGFAAGVKAINPAAQVIRGYTGVFDDRNKGKELALTQFSTGIDIIYHASGACGIGVIKAAEEKGKYAIGWVASQKHLAPKNVLTSMLIGLDDVIYNTGKDLLNGLFNRGHKDIGLKEEAVGLEGTGFMTQDVIEAVNHYKNMIISGGLTVPKTLQELN